MGIEAALGRPVDIAINHSPVALAVHEANHPETDHLVSNVWDVDPLEATGGRPVDLLWASPDCTHFSIARGGKPNRSKKIRSLAWVVTRWAKAVTPRVILLENVREFQTWGPLDGDGRVVPHLKGRTFKQWIGRLRNLGYQVDWRILNAADYGAPTSRRRLFLVARCDGKPIEWPTRTHGAGRRPYRTAAECIDWSIPCPSIFERKRPLAEKTLWRIANGIRRFVLDCPAPYIVKVNHGRDRDRSAAIDAPLSTVTAARRGHAVVAPHFATVGHGEGPSQGPRVEPVDRPMPTVTGSGIARALVAPSLLPIDQQGAGPAAGTSPEAPLGTTTTKNRHALCAAFLAKHYGDAGQRPGLFPEEPLATITACDHHSIVAPVLVEPGQRHGRGDRSVEDPASTVVAKDRHAIAAACLAKFRGTRESQPPSASVEEPLPTVSAGGIHVAEVRAFLLKYYGTAKHGCSLFDPADTITAKDRLGLVTVEGVAYQIVDIGMRMLEPHELLRAQFGDFAATYDLSRARTKAAKVRLIGNSVCPDVVRALVEANTAAPAAEAVA